MQNPFIRRATGVVALVAVAGLTACVTQPQQSNYPPPYQAPGYQNQGYQNQGNAPYGTEYGRVVHIESLQSQQQNVLPTNWRSTRKWFVYAGKEKLWMKQ